MIYPPDRPNVRPHEINSEGYRCPEFKTNSKGIISIGCSYVFGDAMRQDTLFHQIVVDTINNKTGSNLINWNLGKSGGSNDYIARTLYEKVPILRPNMCIINFTCFTRREYFEPSGRILIYGEWAVNKSPHADYLKALSNPYEDRNNFIKNYRFIEMLMTSYKIPWYYSSLHSIDMIQDNYVGIMEAIDNTWDGHPGVLSHQQIANAYLQKIELPLIK